MAKKKMINSQCRIQTKTCLYALFLSDVLLGLLQSLKVGTKALTFGKQTSKNRLYALKFWKTLLQFWFTSRKFWKNVPETKYKRIGLQAVIVGFYVVDIRLYIYQFWKTSINSFFDTP